MSRTCVSAAAVCVLLAAPASGQESALREGLDKMGRDIAAMLNREAKPTGERLRVSFRPARTVRAGMDIYCGPLSSGLPNALYEKVQSWRGEMSSFDLAVADARAVEPPDVTMTWAWDGAESVRVEAHVLLAGEGGRRFSASLDAAALTEPERACLFAFRPGGGKAEAKTAGILREEPSFDPAGIVRPFEAGETFRFVGELSSEAENGVVWSVVLGEDPNRRGGFRNLFAAELAGGAVVREPDDESPRVPAVGDVFRDCAHCPEMVVVPSGSFTMGSPSSEEGRDDNEGPRHRVTIGAAFAVGAHEVTRGEFGRFVSSTGRSMGDSCWTWEDGERKDRSGRGWRNPGFSQGDSHPVVCVSWDDARAYVRWLSGETGASYRLLSESEWEYVARGGTQTRYWWGDGSSSQCRYANGADASSGLDWGVDCDDGYSRTSPVGSFEGNSFGLHDVHGNVYEWVEDCWNDSYDGAPDDGSAWERGDCSLRVLRGGSWYSVPRYLRAANRFRSVTGIRSDNLGFRVARTFTP